MIDSERSENVVRVRNLSHYLESILGARCTNNEVKWIDALF